MREIDTLLVKQAEPPAIADEAQWRAHQESTIRRLREITFRHLRSMHRPRLRDTRADGADSSGTRFGTYVFDTEDAMTLRVKTKRPQNVFWPIPTVAFAVQPDARSTFDRDLPGG